MKKSMQNYPVDLELSYELLASLFQDNVLFILKLTLKQPLVFIPPANFVCRGYTVFTLSVRPSVRASVRP